MSNMKNNTSEDERRETVRKAAALSSLGAGPPTEFAKELFRKFIKGEIEHEEMTRIIIEHYTQSE